jgi:hypothetical protein
MTTAAQSYSIGVMKVAVTEQDEAFQALVDAAVAAIAALLGRHRVQLTANLFEFAGPHLVSSEGVYAPLDFLQLGLTEKLERQFHFLLIITEVDLSAAMESYVLALPSQLTNIGIVSTKRLAPHFWGQEGGDEVTVRRLVALCLHTLGHLLNLPHHHDETNVMYDFHSVTQLDTMVDLSDAQLDQMRRQLPREARSQVVKTSHIPTMLGWLVANAATIWRTVRRANPFRLAFRLPTMVTAGLSLLSVRFFTAEIWDVTNALSPNVLVVFSLIAVGGATLALHKAFAVRSGSARNKTVVEAAVVTEAASVLCLLLTILVLYILFAGLGYLGATLFFPRGLMEAWSSLDPATDLIDHVKLAMFLGAMGVLGGSLGGRADRRDLIRHVLFVDEES